MKTIREGNERTIMKTNREENEGSNMKTVREGNKGSNMKTHREGDKRSNMKTIREGNERSIMNAFTVGTRRVNAWRQPRRGWRGANEDNQGGEREEQVWFSEHLSCQSNRREIRRFVVASIPVRSNIVFRHLSSFAFDVQWDYLFDKDIVFNENCRFGLVCCVKVI